MTETREPHPQPVILLSSREPILRLGLSRWLEQQNLAQVVTSDQPGELQNLLSERLQQTQPLVNLLVVDLEPADIPLCQSLRRRYPHLPILALGPPVSRDQLLQFQQLGLAAYVERTTPAYHPLAMDAGDFGGLFPLVATGNPHPPLAFRVLYPGFGAD
jgi:CheY-like chemotaxis protein